MSDYFSKIIKAFNIMEHVVKKIIKRDEKMNHK
jgi:hypothetical protein